MGDLVYAVVSIVGLLILAIAVHEWAHVAMARFLGDDLGTRLGRFTLNPLAHIDPFWTVGLPTLLVVMSHGAGGGALPFFAAGKPAPYNPNRLTRPFFGKRITQRTAELLVAAAGPASNVVLALIVAVAYLVMLYVAVHVWPETRFPLDLLLQFFVLNIVLAAFNLIPIPPLDGSKVLFALLPPKAAERYEAVAARASWILFAVIIFGGGHFVLGPVISVALGALRSAASVVVG